MIGQWISSVPIIAFSIIAGALSDVFGRKPLILVPLIGDFLSAISSIINFAFIETLPMEFFYAEKINSFFGGYAVYYLGIYSYGTSVTKQNERTHRLSRLDGTETFAMVIGTILAPVNFKTLGYFGSYGVSSLFTLAAIIYITLLVDEPTKTVLHKIQEHEVQEPSGESAQKTAAYVNRSVFKMVIDIILRFVQIAITTPLSEMKEVIMKERKTSLKFLILLQFLCFSTYWITWQIWSLIYLYMDLVFEGFTETDYSHYYVAMAVLNTFCLFVVMPILSVKLALHDALILFIILVCEVVSYGLTPLALSLWQFYLVQGLGTIGYCKFAAVRSLISSCIDESEVGKVFSFLAVLASLAPVAGNPLFRLLYNATLDSLPGAIFLLYAAILLCSALGNLYIYFKRRDLQVVSEKASCDPIDTDLANQCFETKL